MRILLDTHIFLWLIDDSKRLSDSFRQVIHNLDNEIFLSVVSTWECVIKYQIGKLDFPSSYHLLKTKICYINGMTRISGGYISYTIITSQISTFL